MELQLEELTQEQRKNPWVKTLTIFGSVNLLTALLLVLAWYLRRTNGFTQDVKAALGLAAVIFAVSLGICINGHLKGWQRATRTCPLKAQEQTEPKLTIRTATTADLDAIARVEAECFPAAEAATKVEFADRLAYYADHFWLMFDGDRLISFVDGFVTDTPDLNDEMYANASLHDPEGAWQMIFGVNTVPAYRNRGYAGQLIRRAVADAKDQGRKGLVLTCKPEKVAYYAKFGFQDEGVTPNSTHGGVVWHQMRLTF